MTAHPFTVLDAPQRSSEWFAARAGLLTGSAVADVFAVVRTKGKEAAARRDLRTRLVCEQLLGRSLDDDGFVSKDMQRGIDREPDARAAYEAHTGALVTPVGFLRSTLVPGVGCSPDGLLEAPFGPLGTFAGVLELKCPRPANHLGYVRAPGRVPSEHLDQVRHALFVSGASYCDFVSYAPEFPAPLDLFIVRVLRTTVDLDAYRLVIELFLGEVETELAEVRALWKVQP